MSGPRRVLFLCSGNYYRSRFAEILFNRQAGELGLDVVADSAGLLDECPTRNPGPLSPHAVAGLRARGIAVPTDGRGPRDVRPGDFASSAVVVALNEPEHRPLVEQRFPEQGWRVRYWRVQDVYEADPSMALDEIEGHVSALVKELATRPSRAVGRRTGPRAPRVLLVTDVTEPGGVGTHLAQLAAAGRDAGWDVSVLMDDGAGSDGLARRLVEAGVPTERAAIYRKHATERELRDRVSSAYARTRPDVVHVHCGSPRSAVLPRVLALDSGLPLVVTEHLVWPELELAPSLASTLRGVYGGTDTVISVSRDNRRLLREQFRLLAPRHRVIESWVGLPARPPPLRAGAPPYRALTLARFAPQKGLDVLIDAVAALPAELRARLHLTVVGGGPLRDALVGQAARTGVAAHFTFLGWTDDAASLLASHDLFILPSRAEGQPLALLEAMAVGVPCIASAVAGTPDALGHGRYGALVAPGDVASLAGAIAAFLEGPDALRGKVHAARPHLQRRHDLARNTARVRAVWSSAASRRGHAGALAG